MEIKGILSESLNLSVKHFNRNLVESHSNENCPQGDYGYPDEFISFFNLFCQRFENHKQYLMVLR